MADSKSTPYDEWGNDANEAKAGGATDTGPSKKVVIVGAGFGGLMCARALVKAGVVGSTVDVELVDRGDTLSIGATWQFVWTGRTTMDQCKWPLSAARPQLPGVHLRTGTTLTALDVTKKTLVFDDGTPEPYDILVLATGVVNDATSVPGLAQHGISICDEGHMAAHAAAVADLVDKGLKYKADPTGPKPKGLVVISKLPYKCPPAPFEVVFLVDEMLRAKGAREGVDLAFYCPVPFPFGGPVAAQAFKPQLKKREIAYVAEMSIVRCEDGTAVFMNADKEEIKVTFDQLWSPFPQRAPDVLVKAGITSSKGFVNVDIQYNRPLSGAKDVFVIGDACLAMMPAVAKPFPKAGEFAAQMGQCVADTIVSNLNGGADVLPANRIGGCMVETGFSGAALSVSPSFTNVIHTPLEGKPIFKVTEVAGPHGHIGKVAWINGWIKEFFGEQARLFKADLEAKA